ncbi:MAG: DinB family protein [Planctomycetes bacterium]|nr:DinB family protein [Planctomycetota bacterium]
MPTTRFPVTAMRALLEIAPGQLSRLLLCLPPGAEGWSDGPGRWSIHQVVAHLADIEESEAGWVPRLAHLLACSPGPLPRVDNRLRLPAYAALPLGDLLTRFADARRRSLERLDAWSLGPDALDRVGHHPDRGAVRVAELLSTWTLHDLDHLAQIVRIVGAHGAGDAGPLAPYLRICQPVS